MARLTVSVALRSSGGSLSFLTVKLILAENNALIRVVRALVASSVRFSAPISVLAVWLKLASSLNR
ncbi:hypothetical protein SAMN05880556_104231 [Azospirillum sp. RU38E]|nr:hypothetical protein SAMN05880556_104231 [Azospirillum sp. RU38E]SNS57896.1 hypothetical protein SAMN05880591_104231 [Azospirillum sp. RU37A]